MSHLQDDVAGCRASMLYHVAMRIAKVIYQYILDIGCFSHTLDQQWWIQDLQKGGGHKIMDACCLYDQIFIL